MSTNTIIELKRECEGIEIPSGIRCTLTQGSRVRILQMLGTGYTVALEPYGMYRIDAKDADALGIDPATAPQKTPTAGTFNEQMVWDVLKTVYDPEIPVNVVDLGLIYSCVTTDLEQGGKKIDVKMTMTAPGCGMGNVIKADVEHRLAELPEVKETHVEVVLDPPWSPRLMSEAAKLQLGFDLDYGSSSSPSGFPIIS
jgi:probable FeS assembly SUF system protein SufT